MKDLNAGESMVIALPILVVLLGLVAGIIILQNPSIDPRGRASEITPTPTTAIPPQGAAPEVVCTAIYAPVCAPNGVTTYPNACEAGLVGVTVYSEGECPDVPSLTTPTASPVVFPASN